MAAGSGEEGEAPASVAGGLLVALLGVTVALIPAYDVYADIAAGKPTASAVVENGPLFLIVAVLVAAGAGLARSEWEADDVRTIVGWTVAGTAFTATVFAVILGIQLYVQEDLKPIIIAADAVVIAALGGLAIGVRTAQRRRAERRRFRGLFGHLPNPIVETRLDDGRAVVEHVNAAFTDQFGYEEAAIRGEPLGRSIAPPGSDVDPLASPAEDDEYAGTDIWPREVVELETVDGKREFVRLTVPAESAYGDSGFGIYVDVTAQRQRQERLEVLARILRHDIRNRVNIIDAYAAVLLDQADGQPPEELEQIRTAATDLHTLAERTRIAENLAVESTEQRVIDLEATVDGVVDRICDRHDATIEVTVPPGVRVRASPDLATALIEIIENAVLDDDDPEPTVEVTVEPVHDGGHVDVRVADEGPGIPRDQHEVVSGARERTQVDHADGLGLWLASWISRASGGDLDFESSDDGSVVTLRLRAADPDADVEAHVSRPHPDRRPDVG